MKEFTEQDLETIRNMWTTHSATEIANMLGRTKNSIIGKAHRMLLPAKKVGFNNTVRHKKVKQEKPAPEGPALRQPFKPVVIVDNVPDVDAIPLPEVKEPEVTNGGVRFIDLAHHHCRAPLVGADGHQVWCGRPKVKGSFCAEHYAKFFYAPRKRRRTVKVNGGWTSVPFEEGD